MEQRDVALQHCRELLTGDGVIGTQVVLTVTGHNAGFKTERSAITVKLGDFGVIGRFLNSHARIGCSQFRVNELCTVVNRFGNRAAVFRRIEPREIFFTVDMTRRQHDVVLNHIADCGREPRVLRQLVFLLELGIGQVLVVLGVKVVFLLVGGLSAAIKQLQVNGEKVGVPVFTMGDNQNPVNIAKAAVEHARKEGMNLVFLDTAGRLQIDESMMDELVNIKEAVEIDQTILVVDAMTGQDAVNVAGSFNDKIGVDGVILTKLDGDTRGGAALSIRAVTGKPILYVGMGEKLSDLEQFYPGSRR